MAYFPSALRNQMQTARGMADDAVERAGEVATRLQQDADYLTRYLKTNAAGVASAANDQLRTFGIGPEVLAQAAGTQATKLQRLLFKHAGRHPLGALGVAAVAGVLVGLYYARQSRETPPQAPAVHRRRSDD